MGRIAGGGLDSGAIDGAFASGADEGVRLAAAALTGGVLTGRLGCAGGLLEGGALGGALAFGAASLGADSGAPSGRTLGFCVNGNKMLITSAMRSVAVSTPACSLFTSCRSARV